MPGMNKWILQPSTLQLLRFHFSFFLMPVFWFALSQVAEINYAHATLAFIVLHLLLYPASNGYNSYMDKDTGSIGGIKTPLQPTKELLHITIAMNIAAVLISCIIGTYFALGILCYILVSKAYSYRGIRLKKYPFLGYFTVIIFQGAVVFGLVYHACSGNHAPAVPYAPMIAASLLIGGFYPLTQIYQHRADIKDGVRTISYMLGYRGTFFYCGAVYAAAFIVLTCYFLNSGQENAFIIFSLGMLPVIVYFLLWAIKVWRNFLNADYKHTMQMNIIASACSNIVFSIIFINNHFE